MDHIEEGSKVAEVLRGWQRSRLRETRDCRELWGHRVTDFISTGYEAQHAPARPGLPTLRRRRAAAMHCSCQSVREGEEGCQHVGLSEIGTYVPFL